MFKAKILRAATIVTLWSAASYAQTIEWEIKKHSTNMATFTKEVSAYVNQGHVPVGLTYDKREMYLLYVRGLGIEVSAWQMDWYDSEDKITQGINGRIAEGYLPTAISYTGESLYVMFVKTPNQVQAWKIVASTLDLKDVEAKLKPYLAQNYIPAGITFYGKNYWTLLIKSRKSTIKKYLIESYKLGA
ncbi:MAG: hypothetical protein MUF51_04785, partial [Vicinamibacteria bacterium]|nr:hypothetical protein [Vicinamibacteria bacterium]